MHQDNLSYIIRLPSPLSSRPDASHPKKYNVLETFITEKWRKYTLHSLFCFSILLIVSWPPDQFYLSWPWIGAVQVTRKQTHYRIVIHSISTQQLRMLDGQMVYQLFLLQFWELTLYRYLRGTISLFTLLEKRVCCFGVGSFSSAPGNRKSSIICWENQ